ncbi:MAG: class I SAM-dependent methyltransferase [Ktedonobacteraceae bacterium]|nr:class I SAM-dependent methyltransferase [Ktedonobacteraceae bacterium]
MLERLAEVRNHVLQQARIREGETVLDVGCGDGLIAFGALDYVGKQGKVIFSDISQDLLDHCRTLAQQMQILDRCQFLHTTAQNLGALESQSVDVVTTRSVLIYVGEKQQAFRHFYRVLRPDGRLSIFEPINRFTYPEPPHRFFGYEVMPVMGLTQKVVALYGSSNYDPMMDFDERDLFAFAEQAGFAEVHLELQTTAIPGMQEKDAEDELHRWETFLKSSPNPLAPTLEEALQQALTVDEAEQLTTYLRPLVEKNQKVERSSVAYLWAIKHENYQVS